MSKARRTRPTIRDVAAEAGVSVSSVSRTLNGGIYTSAELHARIMRAVKRLGFEPDQAAQVLRSLGVTPTPPNPHRDPLAKPLDSQGAA